MKIAKTTLGSKILSQHSDHFANLAVDAVMRLKGSGSLEAIQIIKKLGGGMNESYLDDGAFTHLVCYFHVFRLPLGETTGHVSASPRGEGQDSHCKHAHGHRQGEGVRISRSR